MLYLVTGPGGELSAGLYQYDPAAHRIATWMEGDLRPELTGAALGQAAVSRAPTTVVICARYERTTGRYGERGIRYVHMEAGHAAQNLYLQAEALGLGGVVIGAFRDREVARILQLPEDEAPLYLMPIGFPDEP
jgi:SagB-type dehydrogenase family enzyme